MKVRLTQKDLVFGVYWGKPQSLNPGLSIWFAGGDIITLGSTSVLSTRLGMLEMAKTLILKDVITRR